MPASRAQQAATAERRAKAIAMYLGGVTDWQKIATTLGYASRGAAHTDVTRALERATAEANRNADVLRQQELMRLDRLQQALWTKALAGDPKATYAVLGIIDRRCKILGLDAPVRHEVVTLGAVEAEIARLEQELDDRAAAEAAAAAVGD